ncbi:3679_t:CDS:2 [Ambispora gerdemannii]|uniref:3679_t:CDS:1 n=1 Tax=Ambispora gerdemannii TaxID=144530 RepID=A0A9N9ARJ1_9GLOM|nr:3679_t:CDS:2 [Ambispora gerdemannii]
MNLLTSRISSYLLVSLLFVNALVLQLCDAKSEKFTTTTVTTTLLSTTTTTAISTLIPMPTKTGLPIPTETDTTTTTSRHTQTRFPWSTTAAALVPNNFQELPGNPDPSEIHLITAATKYHPASKPTSVSQNSAIREDRLSEHEKFKHLLRALQHTRLVREINRYPVATLFAPTNAAIGEAWWTITREQLLYHFLEADMKLDELKEGKLLLTKLKLYGRLGDGGDEPGQRVKIVERKMTFPGLPDTIRIGDAKIIDKQLDADNGIIHTVNKIIKIPVDINATLHELDARLFTQYLVKRNLSSYLAKKAHLTVFVPIDEAFSLRFEKHERKYLDGNCGGGPDDLELVLGHHVHDGLLYTENMDSSQASTIQGEPITIVRGNGTIKVGDGYIIDHNKDILADNGVIHFVNRISAPQKLHFNALKFLCGLDAINFVGWIIRAGLTGYVEDPETPYTILAPHDDNYDNFEYIGGDKENFLKYHFVEGKKTISEFTNGLLLPSELKTADLKGHRQQIKVSVKSKSRRNDYDENSLTATEIRFNGHAIIGEPVEIGNSIIYILEKALIQPQNVFLTLKQMTDKRFNKFLKAYSFSDTNDTISNISGTTIFAPIDEAFNKLGLVYNYFLHPTGKQDLFSVLKYHVLDQVLYSQDIPQGEFLFRTIEGEPLIIERDRDVIKVKGVNYSAVVTETDVLTRTGVVHVVNSVRIPPSIKITPYKILKGIDANAMLNLFYITNLTSILNETTESFTILLPPEKEFANFTQATRDPERLSQFLSSHIIPGSIDIDPKERKKFPTLLASSTKIVTGYDLTGHPFVELQGALSYKERAKIIAVGKTSNGGGVYQIDKVLVRNPTQHFTRAGLGVLIGLGLIAFFTGGGGVGLWGWQKWRSWGYTPIQDGNADAIERGNVAPVDSEASTAN